MITKLHLILIILSLIATNRVFSQVQLDKETHLWNNHSIERHDISYIAPGGMGEQLWDFSPLDIDNTSKKISFNITKDSLETYTTEIHNSYILSNDTLYQIAEEGTLYKIIYEHPIVSMIFPLKYGDKINNSFEGNE